MDQLELEKKNKIKSAQINNALGVFILGFGIVVLIGMFYSDNFLHEMTDMVAGLVLSGIGGGMIIKAQMTIKANK